MGILTIAFDDGYKDTFRHAAGFLSGKGIQATFAVPSSFIGKTMENRPVVDKAELLFLKDNGHEIASHTVSHRNLLKLFEDEGEKAVREEMARSKESLESALGIKIISMVFPFIENSNNRALREISQEYYSSSRITRENTSPNALPIRDPFSITGTAITSLSSLADLNAMADSVADRDRWLIEVFHLVSRENTPSAHRAEPYRFFTHVDIFKEHVRYILSKKIPVLTQAEAIRSHVE